MAKRIDKNTNEYKQEIFNLVGDEYTILGEYINTKVKILMRHNSKNCENYEYPVTPEHFSRGNRCPRCQHRSYKKTTIEFKNEVYNLVGNEYTVLGEYVGKDDKILMRHNSSKCDNFEWEITPHNFLGTKNVKGRRCAYCAKSKNEKRISEHLKQWGIYSIQHHTYDDLRGVGDVVLSYDVFVPDYNLLIEYQGKQHKEFNKMMHGTQEKFQRQLEHDRRKKKYAEDNKINFLPIWYWDAKNIEKILRTELHIKDNKRSVNDLIHIDSQHNITI